MFVMFVGFKTLENKGREHEIMLFDIVRVISPHGEQTIYNRSLILHRMS